MRGTGVRAGGGDHLGRLDLATEVDQILGGDGCPQLGELVALLVVRVVIEEFLEALHGGDELGALGVQALELLHHLFDLLVLFLVVLDLVAAVRDLALIDGVDEQLLGHRVPRHLGDHGVGQRTALLRVGGLLDHLDQPDHLAMVGGEDVDDVLVGL